MEEPRRCSQSQMESNDAHHLLTVEEVADWLRLTPKGIYCLVEGRRIPFIKVASRVRFFRTDIVAWLRANRVPASAEMTR